MRELANADRIQQFMKSLGRSARGAGTIYFTGGASAVLYGWRASTIDLDLRLDPEPPGIFQELPRLKRELSLNIELASPQDFIPVVPGWRSRSRFIGRYGEVDFYHYDFISQALAKLERGHGKDLGDVGRMLEQGLVTPLALREALESIHQQLVRYPAIEPGAFRQKVVSFLERWVDDEEDG